MMMMSAATAAGICGGLFSLQGGARLAKTVQNGAAAVHLKAVVGGNMGEKLLADGAFQMDKLSAGDALEVEVMAAIPLPNVLVDVGGLGIAAVLAHRPLGAQLGEVAVQRALAGLILPRVHRIQLAAKLMDGELAVGVGLQKPK